MGSKVGACHEMISKIVAASYLAVWVDTGCGKPVSSRCGVRPVPCADYISVLGECAGHVASRDTFPCPTGRTETKLIDACQRRAPKKAVNGLGAVRGAGWAAKGNAGARGAAPKPMPPNPLLGCAIKLKKLVMVVGFMDATA